MAIPAETLAALESFTTSLDTRLQDDTKAIAEYVAYYYFAQFLRGEIGSGGSTSSGGTLTVLNSSSGSYTSNSGSNKHWTVPTGEKWQVRSVIASLVSNSTIGNRAIAVGHTSGDVSPVTYAISVSQTTQAASLTYTYSFVIGQPDSSAVRTGNIVPCTLPYLQLSAGDRLVVLDQGGIDTSGDAITTRAIVEVETV